MGRAQAAEPAMSDEAADPRFGGRYRALELLERAHGIETWVGQGAHGRKVVIRSLAADAMSSAGRKWLELEVDVLNRIADGAGGELLIGEDAGELFLARPFVDG